MIYIPKNSPNIKKTWMILFPKCENYSTIIVKILSKPNLLFFPFQGEFPDIDPASFTDEELGIPPDNE